MLQHGIIAGLWTGGSMMPYGGTCQSHQCGNRHTQAAHVSAGYSRYVNSLASDFTTQHWNRTWVPCVQTGRLLLQDSGTRVHHKCEQK